MKIRGNCYVTCEALYHLIGGKRAGWKPMQMKYCGESHWFLKHDFGIILDPTARQFEVEPDYSEARGRGFLTKRPSKRAQELMQKLLWQ